MLPGMSRLVSGAVAAAALIFAASASAHVERPAYWPDPAPDRSVTPAAGGDVPKVRKLSTALRASEPGATHVVCRPNSMLLLRRSIAKARKSGYDVRPSEHRKLSARQARLLLRINQRLAKKCRFKEIQPAVNVPRNNDRLGSMP